MCQRDSKIMYAVQITILIVSNNIVKPEADERLTIFF